MYQKFMEGESAGKSCKLKLRGKKLGGEAVTAVGGITEEVGQHSPVCPLGPNLLLISVVCFC